MIWKVLYDFERPNWQTFGHVLFVEADRECAARSAGLQAAARREGGATITRLDVTPSNADARARHEHRVAAKALWQANVTAGIANDRRLL